MIQGESLYEPLIGEDSKAQPDDAKKESSEVLPTDNVDEIFKKVGL